jgi:hypothetical protein
MSYDRAVMAKQLKCSICGKRFKPSRPDQQYCAKSCRQKAYKMRQEPVYHSIECENCGTVFESVRTIAKFCSTRCRVAAHRTK